MTKKSAKIVVITVIASIVGCLAICGPFGLWLYLMTRPTEYVGNYPELYSVAINSAPEVKGYIGCPHRDDSPVVGLIEEDAYGRKLFCYTEDGADDTFARHGFYLMICQSSAQKEAFYYDGVNYINAPLATGNKVIQRAGLFKRYPSDVSNKLNDFTEEEINALKEANDWNAPLTLDKCVKVKIVTRVERRGKETAS